LWPRSTSSRCGALRLARAFNCLAAANAPQQQGNSAASSHPPTPRPQPDCVGDAFMLLGVDERGATNRRGKMVLPPLMLFLAWMMFSGFKWDPSF
jgi:hypothetical protein